MTYFYELGAVRWKRFTGTGDVRCYHAPRGWQAEAFTPENHPITGKSIPYQWWIKETYTGGAI
jgi:hypothetical protein